MAFVRVLGATRSSSSFCGSSASSALARCLLLAFVILQSISLISAALSHTNGSNRKAKRVGPVQERNLVKDNINHQSITKENKRYHVETAKYKRFKAPTLAYVTPWNSHGYDVAKIFNAKFTYVAPVWYQIKYDRQQSQIFLTGRHDVDQGWIGEVRMHHNSSTPPQIVPRFMFEGWSLEDYQGLFADQNMVNGMINILVKECTKQNFDGLVLEHGYTLNSHIAPLLIGLANQLHEVNKKLILVLPADKGYQQNQNTVTATTFVWLAEYVDHFSLMTYDFSTPQKPGPTSPLSWMTQSVLRLLPPDHKSSANNLGHKILMGLAFYGYEYWNSQAEPIVGSAYLKVLAAYKPKFSWSSAHHEHSFVYKKGVTERTVYYPTLKSIADRLSLAEDLGVGISIWEIGQGLDYFYDLL